LGTLPWEPGRPSCLIARTVKGKGVDFLENQLLWHYRAPNAEQLRTIWNQLGVGVSAAAGSGVGAQPRV
jgi:transketolase